MKFCQHCGKEIFDEAVICPGCGCSVQNTSTISTLGKPEDRSYNKVVSFIRNAPLFISGLIMSLLTWPMYLWFELNLRIPGSVYSLLDFPEMKIWNNAISSSEILGIFCWIGVILPVLGIVLYLVEVKGIIRKSKLRNICLFIIPVVVAIIIVICAYPAIFNYKSTFSYLI